MRWATALTQTFLISFYELEEITVTDALKRDSVSNLVLTEDIVDADKGVVLARAFEPLTKTIIRSFQQGWPEEGHYD